MNLLDGEGEFTWPNGGRNPSIYRFTDNVNALLDYITLCRYVGEILLNLMDEGGEFTRPKR
jgi:hypothetical protein